MKNIMLQFQVIFQTSVKSIMILDYGGFCQMNLPGTDN